MCRFVRYTQRAARRLCFCEDVQKLYSAYVVHVYMHMRQGMRAESSYVCV